MAFRFRKYNNMDAFSGPSGVIIRSSPVIILFLFGFLNYCKNDYGILIY